jgi:3-phenylpropionate/trans-cinnamate dioxygenase ferredoxin component
MLAQWVRVADAEEIAPGEGKRVEIGDEPIAIWNVDGSFYATSDICSHEESSLVEGDLWDGVVECALHGAQFDVRTGAVLSLPAVFPIATHAVKEEDGALYVEWRSERGTDVR